MQRTSGWALAPMIGSGLLFAVFVMSLFSWVFLTHRIETPPGYVTVLVDKPFWSFFADGGVRPDVQQPGVGLYWDTTKGIEVATYDFKIDELFDDLPTKNQSFIDFKSYLKVRITDPVLMVTKYNFTGADNAKDWYRWYDNSIKEQYRTIVRNVAKNQKMEDILAQAETTVTMETEIRTAMDKLIKEIGVPLVLVDVSLGSASPNQAVKDEIDNTSRQQQRVKSEQQRKAAEDARKEAEEARAVSDNAYRNKMGLNTQEFVALEAIKRYSEACAGKATCLLNVGNNPVVFNAK